MLYTTYFAKLRALPENIIPVSICGKAPSWYAGRQYNKLAPKYGFFSEWKKTHDNNYYIRCFNEQVLSLLDPQQVVDELKALAGSEDIALVCYERPSDFCHRHLVANWLTQAGFPTKEFGQ